MQRNYDEVISDMLRAIDRHAGRLEKHTKELSKHSKELTRQSKKSDEIHTHHLSVFSELSERVTHTGIILERIIRKNKIRV
jgi:hypothetical protein